MYGPGRPFNALKQRHVSSTRTGPWTWKNSLVPEFIHGWVCER